MIDFQTHPEVNHPDFCKTYSLYRRLQHHHLYLVCLFQIEK